MCDKIMLDGLPARQRRKMKKHILLGLFFLTIIEVYSQNINQKGNSIIERFLPPEGYERVTVEKKSFGNYLRTFPLKKYGSPVLLYNGDEKRNKVYISVFDFPLLKTDLIQCADAVIKLKAEYLYKYGKYSEITFHITNGMIVPFERFLDGEQLIVSGNNVTWKSGYKKEAVRDSFDDYLKFIYSYAGTYSLSKEAKRKSIGNITPGDFFIYGGSPGHVVLVLDVAINKKTGRKIMLLGQSYMPSQEFHILKSYENINPWYFVEDEVLKTPEWTFEKGSLMEF